MMPADQLAGYARRLWELESALRAVRREIEALFGPDADGRCGYCEQDTSLCQCPGRRLRELLSPLV
jgi:hypothetical protein